MKFRFHKKFSKDYDRLSQQSKLAFESRLKIFSADPYQAKLNNHPLKGRWQGYRSINISGDLRAVYKEISEEEVIFITLGSHSQLYK